MDDHKYTKNILSMKGRSVTQVMKWETATTVRHFPDDQQSRLDHYSLPAKHSPSTHWVNIAFVLIKSVQFLRSVTFCNSGHVIFAQQTSRTDITQMILPAISSNHYSPPANHHCSHHFVIHLQIGTFFFSNTDIVISELLIANRTDVNTYVWLCNDGILPRQLFDSFCFNFQCVYDPLFQSICCDCYIREYEADNTNGSTYVLFCNKLLDQWTGKIKSYQNRKQTQHQPLPIAPAQWTYFSIERHSIHPWMPPGQNFPQTQTLKTVPEQSQMEETTSKPLKMANGKWLKGSGSAQPWATGTVLTVPAASSRMEMSEDRESAH